MTFSYEFIVTKQVNTNPKHRSAIVRLNLYQHSYIALMGTRPTLPNIKIFTRLMFLEFLF